VARPETALLLARCSRPKAYGRRPDWAERAAKSTGRRRKPLNWIVRQPAGLADATGNAGGLPGGFFVILESALEAYETRPTCPNGRGLRLMVDALAKSKPA